MRFYLDEHLPPAVAALLRRMGIDAVSSLELGLHGVPDTEHLARAWAEGRCLVTRDRDIGTNAGERISRADVETGVLIVSRSFRQTDISGIGRALRGYAERNPEGMAPYQVD